MHMFSFQAYNGAGERVDGKIEAASAAQAAELLHQKGLLAFGTAALGADEAGKVQSPKAQKALSLSDFATFSRQLATLLKAELPVDQCLRLIASQAPKARIGIFADRVATSVVAGRPLSEALLQVAPYAPGFIVPLIRAGEARGTLTPCLVDLARILERRVEVRSRVRGALVYPALLLVLAALTVILVVVVLVPTLMPLFKDSGAAAPVALQLADGFSHLMSENWPLVLVLSGAFSTLMALALRRPSVRSAIDDALLALPGIGDLVRRTNVATVARTLGSLLRNGVPLVGALALTQSVASSPRFQRALVNATEAVKEGNKLTASLKQHEAFPDAALRFVAIGEESSKLDEMLLHLADVADADNERQIDNLLTLLTPAITLFVGVFIGGLILSVMQAVLSVNDIALQ